MPISLGTTTVTALYLGTTSISSAYLGNTQVFGGSFTPLSLFSGGAQGIWLDPSDLSTMFSDRAGTIPVTTPGTVVGKRLDKSGRGNHATAPTDAARPVYGIEPKGGRRNLLTWSEDFGNAVWNTSSITYSATAGFDGVTKNALGTISNVGNRIRTNGNTVLPNTQYTFSFYAKLGTATGNRYAVFDVTNATLFVANVIYDSQLNSSTYTRVSVTFTTPAGCVQIYPYLMNGTTTTGTVFLDAAQLELGSTATAYQRVITAYDITESGVATCHYVQYDGSDDSMSTAAIDFTATDKMSVFAGVRKSGNDGIMVELGPDVNNNAGSFAMYPGAYSVAGSEYAFISGGTLRASVDYEAGLSVPYYGLMTGLGDISGDINRLRVNGTQVGQNINNQGTGNFGNYPLFIGRRNNATLPFNGRDFGLIIVGKAASAGEISDTETWLAARTSGVTI